MANEKVVVTGGQSGIGAALVKKFHQTGNLVAHIDKAAEPSEENIFGLRGDVRKRSDVNEFYTFVKKKLDVPDTLILNAGQGIHERLSEGDPEKWQQIIDLNLTGALRILRAFLPEMLQRKSGNVVFISSVAADHPYEYGGIYAATKAAINVIAETLRLETLPHIRVLNVQPGVVDTPFFNRTISGNQSVESIGWGAIQPEDLAELVFETLNRPAHLTVNNIVVRPSGQIM